MDKWEFFQDAKGQWRWRSRSADGLVVIASAESYHSRSRAVADAMARGYVADGAGTESPLGNRNAVTPDAAPAGGVAWQSRELRRSGYNPYDTAPERSVPERKR